MKTKLFLVALLGLFLLVGCSKDDNEKLFTGEWVNEQKDTLSFRLSEVLIYHNFDPSYSTLYYYNFKEDSISLFPSHSSNLNDRKSYLCQRKSGEIYLYGFNNKDVSIYKQIKK